MYVKKSFFSIIVKLRKKEKHKKNKKRLKICAKKCYTISREDFGVRFGKLVRNDLVC